MSYKLILILSLWLLCMGAYAELESCTEFPKSEADIKAFQLQKKAAESGEASAINKLAEMYLYGRGVEYDTHKAVELYRKVAERGDISAYVGLGEIYRYGYKGVKQDVHEAVKWHFKAATRGHIPSQKTLEKIYKEGLIFADEKEYLVSQEEVDWILGYLSWSLTANQIKALKQSFMHPEFKQIAQLFQQQANQGEVWAQSILGWLYSYGWGVKKDYSEALKWWFKAAEQGNVSAQVRLADRYESSYYLSLISNDNAKSVKWRRKAAQQGHAESQYKIAKMNSNYMTSYAYYSKVHNEEAINWYKQFAAESYGTLNMLGDLYYEGRVGGAGGLFVEKNYQEAVKWYRKLFNLNGYDFYTHPSNRLYRLGLMYENGNGIKQDYQQAYIWFSKMLKGDYAKNVSYSKNAKQGITRVLEYLTVEEIEAADKEVNLTHLKEAKTVHCGADEFREFFITYAYNKDIRRKYTQCPIQSSAVVHIADNRATRMMEYTKYGVGKYTAYNRFVHYKEDYMYHSNVRIKEVNVLDGQAVVIYNGGKNGTYDYTFKHNKCWILIKEESLPY